MKKIISLLLALIMLMSLSVPAFAATGYYYADSWADLVEFLDDLDDGDSYYIEVEGDVYGVINPERETACISADDVEIEFAKRDFCYYPVEGDFNDPFFEVSGDNVTIDFGGSPLESHNASAIEVDGNDCTIKNAWFYYCNNPDGNGGGVLITDNDPGCHIIDCKFYHCKAKLGGGIYIDADDALIENCSFDSCESAKKTGADVYDNEGESIVKNCSTSYYKYDNSFANLKEIQDCTFWKEPGMASMFSGGSIWFIAGVAVIAVAAVAVVIVKKKKAAAAETAEEVAETEE